MNITPITLITPAKTFKEPKLPNEVISMFLIYLSNQNLTVTYSLNKRWRDATLDNVRRREAKRFKCYIQLIAKNTTEEKYKNTKQKIETLISQIKLSENVIIDLLQLKDTLVNFKEQLIGFLKELDSDKQENLKKISDSTIKPLHFHNTFSFVDHDRLARNRLQLREMGGRLDNPPSPGVIRRMVQGRLVAQAIDPR